jgi:hypothetical protein
MMIHEILRQRCKTIPKNTFCQIYARLSRNQKWTNYGKISISSTNNISKYGHCYGKCLHAGLVKWGSMVASTKMEMHVFRYHNRYEVTPSKFNSLIQSFQQNYKDFIDGALA